MKGPCGEKILLMSDYETATKAFSAAVGELRSKMGTVPRAEYERLDSAANQARVKSEEARLAVERHIAAHGC
jgi:hypothetical protein